MSWASTGSLGSVSNLASRVVFHATGVLCPYFLLLTRTFDSGGKSQIKLVRLERYSAKLIVLVCESPMRHIRLILFLHNHQVGFTHLVSFKHTL